MCSNLPEDFIYLNPIVRDEYVLTEDCIVSTAVWIEKDQKRPENFEFDRQFCIYSLKLDRFDKMIKNNDYRRGKTKLSRYFKKFQKDGRDQYRINNKTEE